MDGVEILRYRYAPAQLETLVNDGGIVTNLKRAPSSRVSARSWLTRIG
jgi:hypothetical protein